jgi:formylglycine-generating enzyme required for sulfatase activity
LIRRDTDVFFACLRFGAGDILCDNAAPFIVALSAAGGMHMTMRIAAAPLFAALILSFAASAVAQPSAAATPKAAESFKDCPMCPEMVELPPGSFERDLATPYDPAPIRHTVTINYRLAVGRFEITFDEWDACVIEGGCGGLKADDAGWGRGRRPAIFVSWFDAQSYVQWLAKKTGKPYRLLGEAEWEYAARGGTRTVYWWGDAMVPDRAVCRECGGAQTGKGTLPVGSFPPNPFGLYDTAGNVWEWLADCAGGPVDQLPRDGGAWTGGKCPNGSRSQRGGSWTDKAEMLRSDHRAGDFDSYNGDEVGFRVGLTLP